MRQRQRRGRLWCLSLLVAVLACLPGQAVQAAPAPPGYFPQTGQQLGPHFVRVWQERGGVAFLGYPLSQEFVEGGLITQYFERAVLQYDPANIRTPYAVQGLQLGRLLTLNRTETAFAPVAVAPTGRSYFPETSHTLGGAIGQTWQERGGLIVFGYPLSEEFIETNVDDGQPYLTQYFERARLEYHPATATAAATVTFGLLGRQRAQQLGLLTTASFAPVAPPPALAQTITQFSATQEPVMVLSFDCGGDRGYTAQILDTLAAKQVKASFGVTGVWARANPDLVARIGAEGHHVINHTMDHRSFTGLSDRLGGLNAGQRTAELEQADEIIAPLLGQSTRPWFRPPYGEYDQAALAQLAALGYTYNVMWTIDTQGWNKASVATILDRTLRQAAPGAIVLLHVGSDSQDGPALVQLIDQLRARGYHFATVAELANR